MLSGVEQEFVPQKEKEKNVALVSRKYSPLKKTKRLKVLTSLKMEPSFRAA